MGGQRKYWRAIERERFGAGRRDIRRRLTARRKPAPVVPGSFEVRHIQDSRKQTLPPQERRQGFIKRLWRSIKNAIGK